MIVPEVAQKDDSLLVNYNSQFSLTIQDADYHYVDGLRHLNSH